MTDVYDPFWTDLPAVLDDQGNIISPAVPAPPPVDPDAVRPDVDDVSLLERSRTIHDDGTEVSTFDDQTRPTAAEVESLIDGAVDEVLGQLPPNMDPIWYPAIARVVAFRVAGEIEVSYYRARDLAPERAAVFGESPASNWTLRYAAELSALQALIPKALYVA